MDCNGKNPITVSVVSPSNNFQRINPLAIPSKTCQRIKKPRAKADRFTKIPKKRQNEKNPMSLIKKATKNSRSVRIIDSSLKSEYSSPRISETTKTNTVEISENDITVRNLDRMNSFFERDLYSFY